MLDGEERLTPTQAVIVWLIRTERLTNRQIADRLGIAEGTVRNHLRTVFAKLRIGSREELTDNEKDRQ